MPWMVNAITDSPAALTELMAQVPEIQLQDALEQAAAPSWCLHQWRWA